jgi:hypothetical protein
MEEQEKVNLIANAQGKELYTYWRLLQKKINEGIGLDNSKRYFKLCLDRIKELGSKRFGSWEEAKVNLDHLILPINLFKSTTLEPILGYSCEYVSNPKMKFVVIMNGKTNSCYIRNLGEVTASEVNDIFNT